MVLPDNEMLRIKTLVDILREDYILTQKVSYDEVKTISGFDDSKIKTVYKKYHECLYNMRGENNGDTGRVQHI